MENVQPRQIRDAALRSVKRGGRRFWLLVVLLALPVAWALGSYVLQLNRGLQVTGLNDHIFWGVYTTNLVTFIGFSYGGALVSAILRLTGADWRAPITRIAEATALVTLLVGAAFAVVHIGRPDRLWEFLVTPNGSSPLVWDVIAITTYLVATFIFLYLPLIPDLAIAREHLGDAAGGFRRRLYGLLSLGWQGGPRQKHALEWGMSVMAVLIIPVAVTVHSVLSWAFALTSREGWHSTIFGPYFVVAALYSGVATVIVVIAAFRKGYGLHDFIGERHFQRLGYIMISLGLIYLYFTFAELLTEGFTMTAGAVHVLNALFLGRYALLFWLFAVLGGLLPVLLVALPRTRTVPGITTAAACVAVALWLKRFVILVPTLSVPLIGDTVAFYRPSWVELSITLGAAAAVPLFLILFFRLFPILAIWEMEEVAHRASHVKEAQQLSSLGRRGYPSEAQD